MPFTSTLIVRGSRSWYSLTLSCGVALPCPEPGETSAHWTSARAVHAQLEPVVIENGYRPFGADTEVGIPVTLTVQSEAVGCGGGVGDGVVDGAGDGVGPARGEGAVEGAAPPASEPPQPESSPVATTITAIRIQYC